MPKVVGPCLAALLGLAAGGAATAAAAEEDYSAWPPLRRSFPSTGGAITIGEYDPVIEGDRCVSAFTATFPNGQVFRNTVEFRAVPVRGGTLCTDGEWRAEDGSGAFGATKLRVFFGRDGVRRGSP